MPLFQIIHITRYEYEKPVAESVNEIRIFPYEEPFQETLSHELHISQQPSLFTYRDYWGNKTGVFNLLGSHRELVIESRLQVRVMERSQFPLNQSGGLDALKEQVGRDFALVELARPESIRSQENIGWIIRQVLQPWKSVSVLIQDCSQYIYQHFHYIKGITSVETTLDQVLDLHSGVCQDFAHVLLQVLRTLGIPARYVSGYICPNRQGLRGEGATHAWVEAWIPPLGWAGIDPTNNVWITNNHVKLALGRNFKDCSPVRGTFRGPSRQQLSVFVSVSYEDGNSFEDLNLVAGKPLSIPEQPTREWDGIGAQQ